MTVPVSRVLQRAYGIYNQRTNYAYFMGAKGDLLTTDRMNTLMNAFWSHFSRYTTPQLRQIFAYCEGKLGYDCSGYVGYLIDRPYILSQGMIDECSRVTTDLSQAEAGCILWKQGHVGICVGDGQFLHFPTEDPTLPEEYRTCYLDTISNYNWTRCGWHPNVEYDHPIPGRSTPRPKGWFKKYLFRRGV